MDNKKTAVVLLSGGMDSALCTALAIQDGFEVAGLHLNYGQLTQERELRAFNDVADYYHISKRLVVDVTHLSKIGGSSLTDRSIRVSEADLDNTSIPTSYVPFRNANILAISASWAEVLGATALYIGAMQLDSSGYPDCRREFFDAFEKAIDLGTRPETDIRIITPIIDYTKKDIIVEGNRLGVPFDLTWSCYQETTTACGLCDSCALRLRGFAQAGIADPLNYSSRPNYLIK